MRINSVVRRIEQIYYVYKTFRELSPYIQKGNYFLLDNMRSIIREGDEDKYSIYFRKEPKGRCDRLLIRILNNSALFSNRKAPTTHDMYGAMYIANNNDQFREVKLLDAINKKVKVFFVTKKAKTDFIELTQYLSDICHMPRIHSEEERDNSLTVSLITRKKSPQEARVIEDICYSHARMLKRVGKNALFEEKHRGEQLSGREISVEANALIEYVAQYIPQKLLDTQYTICLQHGDLSADNLIYGKADGYEGYWWIDWEHIQERVFFYDVFFYIINTAVTDNNYVPTEEFLAGCYDKYLERLFEAAGHKYVAEERKKYFLLFAIAFIWERLGRKGLQMAVMNYRVYLEKYFIDDM